MESARSITRVVAETDPLRPSPQKGTKEMFSTNGASKLQVQFDTHHCRLSAAEKDKLLSNLDALGRQVGHFPVADLHVLIEFNSRNNDYSVKTTLILPGTTLVGNDHDTIYHAAFE